MASLDIKPSEFYETHSKERTDYETRAENHAALTLPYIIRAEGASSGDKVIFKRAQSFCGGLVNNLKSKMGLALLPPSTSSFRFRPDPQVLIETYGDGETVDKDGLEELHSALSSHTENINSEIEVQQVRPSLFQIIDQLLVVGSVVAEKVESKGLLLHTLKSFAVKLNRNGDPLGICVVENLYKEDLPEGIEPKDDKQEEFKLYTLVHVNAEGKWERIQELDGEIVGEEATYPDYMSCPFRYLGWKWVTGDKYHRPYVEDYFDDMEQLNKLAELLTRGSLAAAKVLFLVDESIGRTDKDDIANAPTGSYRYGKADDVTVVQANKNYDFQAPAEREANLKRELSKMFLSTESTTRQAERVTAYEVQIMARELEESTLGGIYSSMALHFSKWLVHQIMLEKGIKFETIEPEILTGLDALGRSQEAQKLDGYVTRMTQLGLTDFLVEEELTKRYAEYDGINTKGLVRKTKDVEKIRKQRADAQARQVMDESVAGATGDIVKNSAAGQG